MENIEELEFDSEKSLKEEDVDDKDSDGKDTLATTYQDQLSTVSKDDPMYQKLLDKYEEEKRYQRDLEN